MTPTAFDEENAVLNRPPDTTADQCDPLSVHISVDPPLVISCWKLEKQELEWINKTGKVWLIVRGHDMPPVSLEVAKPFINKEKA